MLKWLYQFERVKNKIKRAYRNRIFYERTGQRANLVGDITLFNTNLKIGKNVSIYPYVQIFGDGLIEIEDNVDIGTGTIIYASKMGGVHIGKNSMVAGQCYIIDADHGTAANECIRDQRNVVSPIFIGEDVWIAANVTVLKGSKINNGAIIGANALVNNEIPANAIAVGIPAKIKSHRK